MLTDDDCQRILRRAREAYDERSRAASAGEVLTKVCRVATAGEPVNGRRLRRSAILELAKQGEELGHVIPAFALALSDELDSQRRATT